MDKTIVTAACFNGIDSNHIRFIHEISKTGNLEIVIFSDELIRKISSVEPKYKEPERRYFLESVRYVSRVHTIDDLRKLDDVSGIIGKKVDVWFTLDVIKIDGIEKYPDRQGIEHKIMAAASLSGFPEHDYDLDTTSGKKVLVTGCFDWFHSGHVRFFEEASEYGDLYVVLGHDKNLEKLKGPGHPMFPEEERKYLAGSVRFVKQALVSTGEGWLDAEPEIRKIKPDIYLVNEDGDKDVKRRFCDENGIEYLVLKREPKPGLTRRTSTDLRGF